MKLRLVAAETALDVEDGRIVPPGGAPDLVLDLGGAEVRPGLFNAHDHLHRNHFPRLGNPPYGSVYTWGDDLHARCAPELARCDALPRERALLFGALKNLLGGVTTAVHHDSCEESFGPDFPIRVPCLRAVHTLRLDGAAARAAAGSGAPVAIHLAEGTDSASSEEVREADRLGLLGRNLLAIHLVGADADGIARLRRSGAAVVWCPTSNLFLYGRTALPSLLSSVVDVLVGTDALVSGDGTLLHELAAARALGVLPDDRLEAAVGRVAATRLGLPQPSLSSGAPADVVALRRPLLSARPRDVALVLVAGRPALADETLGDVFAACSLPVEPLSVGGVAKLVASPLGAVAREVFDLTPSCRRIVQ
jgi:cytosine/adenosine deaminase-related metal-dependent hydrolase